MDSQGIVIYTCMAISEQIACTGCVNNDEASSRERGHNRQLFAIYKKKGRSHQENPVEKIKR
jgi:hypothetical protein